MRSHPSAIRHISLITVLFLLMSLTPASPALAHRGDGAPAISVAALPPIGPRFASSNPGTTVLITQSGGVQGDGDSELPAVSADGRYVAFQSAATNLVVPDSNLKEDVFVADRTSGAHSLASVSTSGARGDGHSFGAAISADGRYVAFASFARNLADGITTPIGKSQIYRRDRTSGTTTLVSPGLGGTGGNGSSGLGFRVAISADGQLIAYDSLATDLINPDANNRSDTFVWDAGSSTTTLVSLSTAGVQGDNDSSQPTLSGDGRFVAFESFATNLTTGGTNGEGQIYVRDRTAGTTTKVSVSTGGVEGNAQSKNAAVSADGRFIAFDSTSTNLTADAKVFSFYSDVYARDQTSGTTVRVSLNASGSHVNGNSKDAAVSSNGTRISFTSDASFGPPDPAEQIYVRNQTTGEVVQVSVSSGGATGDSFSENSSISGDGLITAFRSLATNLVSPATTGRQIFVNVQTAGPAADFGEGFPYTLGFCGFCAVSRDPVNLATGSFTSHADDLVLPGRVLHFAFARWYNSADPVTGPLGAGWTHSYNWSLSDVGTTVDLRRGDGRRDIFTRNPDGTYAESPNVVDTLVKNGDGSFTLTLTSQVQYEFTGAGRLNRIHEPAGNQLTLTYTGSNLTSITDTVGRQVALTYDGSNRLMQLQDPLGRKVTYAYDANSRLSTVTDKIGNAPGQNPALHQWTYAYDGATRHITTITDPDGRVRVTNSYDSQGRVYEQRDALNKLTQIGYGLGQTVVTNPHLHATTYTFDSRMRVLTQADTVGPTTYTVRYVYDASGNRTSVTDRSGKTTDFTYDTRGNVWTKTDPQIDPQTPRYVTQFGYDTKNNLIQITDPRSFVTTMTYDPVSNVPLSVQRQIEGTIQAITKYEYGDPGNPGLPTKAIAPRGNTGPTPNYSYSTSLSYDTQGNLIQRLDPDGAKITFGYDAAGRLRSFVDPDGYAAQANPADHTWTIDYDENDRETTRTDPLGHALVYGYDGVGDRTTVADRRGNVTVYGYDANTRLETVQQRPDPSGQPSLIYTTQIVRDANGNATRMTQANGVVTDYVFDALDRLTSVTTHPDAQTNLTTNYVLDGNGQPLTRTTGDGVTVTYGYDAATRLVSVAAPGLATITYAYDAAGQRTQMIDGTGTTTYQYDGLGRATQVAASNGTLTYVYDLDGNRTTLVYPGSQGVTYAYSPGGRLNTVTDWASRVSTYTYKDSGLVATLQYPNSMRATYVYDRAQRLTQITNAVDEITITQHSYTLDAQGNRTALDEYVQGITAPPVAWDAGVRVNTDSGTTEQKYPAMATGADGTAYLIWGDGRNTGVGGPFDIYFSLRSASANGWSTNEKVTDVTSPTNSPAIGADTAGGLYAVWTDFRNGNTDIYSSVRSAATGTWSANSLVNDDAPGKKSQDNPRIAVTGAGTAISVWDDRRSNEYNIYSARRVAGGSTWSTNMRVTDNTSSVKSEPDVAFAPDGTATAVWGDARGGNGTYDVYAATLPSGGGTWSANTRVNDQPTSQSFCPTCKARPRIGADSSGNAFVAWIDSRTTPAHVQFTRRPSGSSTWPASAALPDSQVQASCGGTGTEPCGIGLSVRSDGVAYLVWQDARDGFVWGSRFDPSSGGWSVRERVSDAAVNTGNHTTLPPNVRVAVSFFSSQVTAAWEDARNGNPDIFARRAALSPGIDHFDYSYDGINRLTSVSGALAETFTLDPVSNVTSHNGSASSYDDANRLVNDGSPYSWSTADRLTQRNADTFSYDPLDRLVTSTVNGVSRTYAYDGAGQLFSRTGPEAMSFLWEPTSSQMVSAGADRVVVGMAPLYIAGTGSYHALARDGLGSIRAEVDEAQVVQGSARFLAYGEVAAQAGSPFALLGYAGELRDGSGLIDLRARWYDPRQGRFMSRDAFSGSAFVPGSLNAYSYAGANPITAGDPSGLCTDPSPGALGPRYCVERFIPEAMQCPSPEFSPCGRGDNRGPSSNGGTYKAHQTIDAGGRYADDIGYTTLLIGPFTSGPFKGQNLGCGADQSAGTISLWCATLNGAPFGLGTLQPPINTRVTIVENPNGTVRVTAYGTFYPSLEVWRYSGGASPELVFFYDATGFPLSLLAFTSRLPNSAGK